MQRFRVIIAVGFLTAISACGESEQVLPNNYRLIELSRGNHAITRADGSFAVYPNIVKYRMYGDVIVGQRRIPPDNADAKMVENTGYFIFNTTNQKLQQGLQQRDIVSHGYVLK